MFVGVVGPTGGNTERRALIAFDISGAIPTGSVITVATLTMQMTQTTSGPLPVDLHRLLADWGEADSDAPRGEGGGATAKDGDATWTHRFRGGEAWSTIGGDFASVSSSNVRVSGERAYTWESTTSMVADVQAWLDNPSSNFGWILVGADVIGSSAKRFASRDSSSMTEHPALTIEFAPGG